MCYNETIFTEILLFETKIRPLGAVVRPLPFSGQILGFLRSLSFSGQIFEKFVRSLSFRTKNRDLIADKKAENG